MLVGVSWLVYVGQCTLVGVSWLVYVGVGRGGRRAVYGGGRAAVGGGRRECNLKTKTPQSDVGKNQYPRHVLPEKPMVNRRFWFNSHYQYNQAKT